jgi:hypothetical protein
MGQRKQKQGSKATPGGYVEMQESLQKLRKYFSMFGKEEWWWLMDESRDEIARLLKRDNYVVIDGFMLEEQAAAVRQHVVAYHERGELSPGGIVDNSRKRVRIAASSRSKVRCAATSSAGSTRTRARRCTATARRPRPS